VVAAGMFASASEGDVAAAFDGNKSSWPWEIDQVFDDPVVPVDDVALPPASTAADGAWRSPPSDKTVEVGDTDLGAYDTGSSSSTQVAADLLGSSRINGMAADLLGSSPINGMAPTLQELPFCPQPQIGGQGHAAAPGLPSRDSSHPFVPGPLPFPAAPNGGTSADTRPKRKGKIKGNDRNNLLRITNVPIQTPVCKIRSQFAQYGKIQSIEFTFSRKSRGCAIIRCVEPPCNLSTPVDLLVIVTCVSLASGCGRRALRWQICHPRNVQISEADDFTDQHNSIGGSRASSAIGGCFPRAGQPQFSDTGSSQCETSSRSAIERQEEKG
jgi:hypothetical protein